jgi:hypothetical protein
MRASPKTAENHRMRGYRQSMRALTIYGYQCLLPIRAKTTKNLAYCHKESKPVPVVVADCCPEE